ncbi:MAG TPA: hypothetical protein VL551_10290 [Actinospica sp.]|jgi:hypothetical protein|nr:hypothetical protein [Actinospica sp.]
MTVKISRGRHRRPKHRITRSLAAALLITLLVGTSALVPMHRPTYSVTEER